MSMLQLQETRVAQLLQNIRHQVENPLQKRIRNVIKAWQKLLEPGAACATVIPLQRSLPIIPNNSSLSNGSTSKLSSTSSLPDSSPSNQSSNGRLKQHRNHQPESQLRPPDRIKKVTSTSTVPPPLPNGSSPKPPQVQNGRSLSCASQDAPKLAKVKSTAELIREAGGCIDSVTKDRILSNRIAKESDEFPRLVPFAAMRSSRKPKQASAPSEPQQKHQQSQSKSTYRNQERSLPPPLPPPPIPSKAVSPQRTSSSITSTKSEVTAKPPDRGPRRLPSPTEIHSVDNNSQHHHRDHKDKRKHMKRRLVDQVGDESEKKKEGKDGEEGSLTPPVTNHMDDWPALPPLTDELLQQAVETLFRDYRSGKTPSREELADSGRLDDLIRASWEGVSATRDDSGCLQPMTALYSIELGEDDQLVHILPWTNLEGYRQTFFPQGTTTPSDIDRLIDLPKPW